MAEGNLAGSDTASVLREILSSVRALQQDQTQLASAVDAINGRVNVLAGVKTSQDGLAHTGVTSRTDLPSTREEGPATTERPDAADVNGHSESTSPPPARRPSTAISKIILTTHPGQAGVDPVPMNWGAKDPTVRGPGRLPLYNAKQEHG